MGCRGSACSLIHHRKLNGSVVRSVGKLTLGWRRPQRSCLAGAAEVVGISYGRPGTTRSPGAMGRYPLPRTPHTRRSGHPFRGAASIIHHACSLEMIIDLGITVDLCR